MFLMLLIAIMFTNYYFHNFDSTYQSLDPMIAPYKVIDLFVLPLFSTLVKLIIVGKFS